MGLLIGLGFPVHIMSSMIRASGRGRDIRCGAHARHEHPQSKRRPAYREILMSMNDLLTTVIETSSPRLLEFVAQEGRRAVAFTW